jgi:hypothetical protein
MSNSPSARSCIIRNQRYNDGTLSHGAIGEPQLRLGISSFQRLYMGLLGRDSKIENRRTEPVLQQSGTELS